MGLQLDPWLQDWRECQFLLMDWEQEPAELGEPSHRDGAGAQGMGILHGLFTRVSPTNSLERG